MAEHKMTVVDGVRFRPEHAPDEQQPKQTTTKETSDAQHKARRPSRSPRSGDNSDDE